MCLTAVQCSQHSFPRAGCSRLLLSSNKQLVRHNLSMGGLVWYTFRGELVQIYVQDVITKGMACVSIAVHTPIMWSLASIQTLSYAIPQCIRILIWYMVLPQGKRQFLFAIRVGCVVVWPIFSTSKMKSFCIYFYQGNITFKNVINLVSFIINLVEYLVINSYSVTDLDNFRKETSDRA